LLLAARPSHTLNNKPLIEDGFYSLSVSKNLGTGHGLTIDGHQPTNGFQPAMTIVESLVFLGHGNRTMGLRGVLFLSWLTFLCTAFLLSRICRDMVYGAQAKATASWFAALAFLAAPFVMLTFFNGLETGAVLLMYAVIWRYSQTHSLTSLREVVTVGVLIGTLILCRIDAVFFLVAFCGAMLLERSAAQRLSRAAFTAAVALTVSAPWFIYNQLGFGSLLPTSGRAEQSVQLTLARFPALVTAVADVLVPWTYVSRFDNTGFAVVRLCLLAAGVGLLLRWRRRDGAPTTVALDRRNRSIRFAAILAVALVAMAGTYYVESGATDFYGRYLAPACLLVVVLVSTLLFSTRISLEKVLAPIAVLLTAVSVIVMSLLTTGKLFPGNTMYSQQLALVNKTVPAGETVAAGQSGTLGFFRDRVVNLDGKVNSDALAHQHDMGAYLAAHNIHWLCDWDGYAKRYLGQDPGVHGWTLVATQGLFELWHNPGA
jgi:hypothetical protein